jgi:TfoX/Sxy family transcriptional regulator of competence genes
MAEPYFSDLKAILARAAAGGAEIVCKHFFGGAAAYADGRIFTTLTPAGLALKLAEEDRGKLREEGAKPLRYFPKAPIKKDYVVLPDSVREDRRVLEVWIGRSIEFATR